MQSTKGTKPNAGSILMSVIMGIATTIILLLVTAALVRSGQLEESKVGITLVAINIIAGLACGIAARICSREGGSVNGIIGGAAYSGVMITVAFLLDMQTPQGAIIIKIITISIVFSFIGSKLNLAKSNKKLRKKRKS